jgi:hypothetical protein
MKKIRPIAIGWLAALLIAPSLGLANQDDDAQDSETSVVIEETEYPYENLSLDEGPNEKEARKRKILSNLEPGFGLGISSWEGNFTMQLNASLGYYVLNWLQPGLELAYVTDFGSSNYPDSFRILPFLKFVFMRGKSFAPYVMAAGGREFQWAGAYPVHSWIVGPGVGAYIGAGKRIVINIEVLFLHYWYDNPRVVGYPDDSLYTHDNGNTYFCPDDQCNLDGWVVPPLDDSLLCESLIGGTCVEQANDKKDRDREWIFPIISLGVGFLF